MLRLAVLLALLQAGAIEAPPRNPSAVQEPARDGARPSVTGTASIRGLISDRETGRPLAGALVELYVEGEAERDEVTGPDGRYAFDGLPAGRYGVEAGPGEHRATHLHRFYGAARSIEQAGRRPGFDLKTGERRSDVDVELDRALAIAGRVLNPAGEPLANLFVMARSLSRVDSVGAPTDDRGMFRIFGLAAGAYRVCTDPRSPARSAPTETIGERPVRTCAPAAVSESEAQIVTLAPGSEPMVEIRLQRRSMYSVSGTVVDAAGLAVERGHVTAVALDGERRAWSDDIREGLFSLVGLPPGRYGIQASTGSRENPAATLRGPALQHGLATVQVDAGDVSGVTIALSKAARVRGRIVVEDTGPAPNLTSLRIFGVVLDRVLSKFESIDQPVGVAADRTFSLENLWGPQVLVFGGVPDGWFVRSVGYRNRDIRGLPTEFGESESIDVVLGRHGASLSVRVTGDRPAEDCDVLLLPSDPAGWEAAFGPWRRRPSFKQGELRFEAQPPGEYLVLAIDGDIDSLELDRDDVQRLAKSARRVTLVAGEDGTVEVRAISIAEVR